MDRKVLADEKFSCGIHSKATVLRPFQVCSSDEQKQWSQRAYGFVARVRRREQKGSHFHEIVPQSFHDHACHSSS